MLLQRDPDKVPNTADFKDALHLYYDKQTVISFNAQKLLTLNKPIAMIKAIHNCATAASAKPNDADGLYPILFVSRYNANSKFMATSRALQWCSRNNPFHFVWTKSESTRSTNCNYGSF